MTVDCINCGSPIDLPDPPDGPLSIDFHPQPEDGVVELRATLYVCSPECSAAVRSMVEQELG